jgi:rSAM/selenodomain-associated transferase 1
MTIAANALVVMAKAPRPGESKTRLVPPLTFEEAAELARALLIDQTEHLAKIDAAELFIAFAPENSRALFAELMPARFSCFPQDGKDLGERMRQAFQTLFARGFGNIVLIGSDLPPIPLQTFSAAYASLGAGRDIVLGPSEDGGYYLVGISRLVADIFEGIHWSRSDVLDRTLEKINRASLSYEILAPWRDIDTPEDLVRVYTEHQASPFLMKNSATVLQELRQRGKL